MRQQINLYQAVLIDKPEPLQGRQAGLIIGGFVALLVFLSLFAFWQYRSVAGQLSKLQQQKSELETRLISLAQQFPERQKSTQLEEDIARIKLTLIGQKQLLGYFAGREEKGNAATLEVLEGLARHSSPGVWLSKIKVAAASDNIALSGSALRPEQVPQYLQALGEKQVLGGQVFSRLSLARLQEKPGQVDFTLESSAEGQ